MVAPTTAGQVAPPVAVQPAYVTPTALAAVPALLAVNVTLVAASGPLLTTTAVKEAVVPPGTAFAGPDIVTEILMVVLPSVIVVTAVMESFGIGSASRIVPRAVVRSSVAPTGFDRLTLKVSVPS